MWESRTGTEVNSALSGGPGAQSLYSGGKRTRIWLSDKRTAQVETALKISLESIYGLSVPLYPPNSPGDILILLLNVINTLVQSLKSFLNILAQAA